MHHRAVRDDREVRALARDPRLAERDDVLAVGHVFLRRAVVELRLEDDDRVRVADRRGEQTLRVGGRRRDRDLHARRVDVVRLRRVVVQLGRAHAAAVRHPDRERERHRPARPPAVAADVVDELVERRVAERVVLHLADRPPAGHAQADGGAEDPGLGERRVDAAIGAEALLQPCGRAEDAAELADVLAHDHAPTRRAPSRRGARRSRPRRGSARSRRRGSSGARRGRAPATAAGRRTRARRRATGPPAARPRRPRSRRA